MNDKKKNIKAYLILNIDTFLISDRILIMLSKESYRINIAQEMLTGFRAGKIKKPEGKGLVYLDINTGEAGIITPGSDEEKKLLESLPLQDLE